jgi:hypothetical protein
MNAELLAIIERGEVGRFSQSARPTILPKGHAFSVSCGCAECDHVWTKEISR